MTLRIDIGNKTHFVTINEYISVSCEYRAGYGSSVTLYKGKEPIVLIYVHEEQGVSNEVLQALVKERLNYVKMQLCKKIEEIMTEDIQSAMINENYLGKDKLSQIYFV